MSKERNPDERSVLTKEECASVGHPLTVDVLGGMTCPCGSQFEFLYHVSAVPPKKPTSNPVDESHHGDSEGEILRFGASPSFDPRLEIRLVLRQDSSGERASFLACQLTGYTADCGAWEIPLTPGLVASILRELEGIRLPPVSEARFGLDGTGYTLSVTGGFNEWSVSWWQSLPDGWKPLAPLLNRLLSLAGPRAAGIRVR